MRGARKVRHCVRLSLLCSSAISASAEAARFESMRGCSERYMRAATRAHSAARATPVPAESSAPHSARAPRALGGEARGVEHVLAIQPSACRRLALRCAARDLSNQLAMHCTAH